MDILSIVKKYIFISAIITLVYLFVFFSTFLIIIPWQRFIFPSFDGFASLIFLPHGVRILVAWLYRWNSVWLLAPGAFVAHIYLYGLYGLFDYNFYTFVLGISCGAIVFWLLAKLGVLSHTYEKGFTPWQKIILAGILASLLNAFGSGFILNLNTVSIIAYFMGDITGLIFCLVVLMFTFRVVRIRNH